MSINIEQLKESLALQMMRDGGFDPDNREDSPLEWDLNTEDSQYSIAKDIADEHVDFILKELMSISVDEDEDEDEDEEYVVGIRREKTNTTSACLFIFMDAGDGNPRYVRDVRQWLANVDAAGIPDDTEIDGQLYLDYDIRGNIATLKCEECGEGHTVVYDHSNINKK